MCWRGRRKFARPNSSASSGDGGGEAIAQEFLRRFYKDHFATYLPPEEEPYQSLSLTPAFLNTRGERNGHYPGVREKGEKERDKRERDREESSGEPKASLAPEGTRNLANIAVWQLP